MADFKFGNQPIDRSRPILENNDGTFSTEETITEQDPKTGLWVNIPTIVQGKRYSPEAAMQLYELGQNKAVGTFGSLDEAVSAARQRTNDIGNVRRDDHLKNLENQYGIDVEVLKMMGE